MIVLDSDVFTLLTEGDAEVVARSANHDPAELSLPIIVVEEAIRGRFNLIRRAESGKGKTSLVRAYELLQETIEVVSLFPRLAFTDEALKKFLELRKQFPRLGTQDLRIAATCIVHSATLVTRNRRDFEKIPGLTVEFW